MNQYGLDYKYFKKNLKRIVAEIDCYTPDEMQRALERLASVAKDQADTVATIRLDEKQRIYAAASKPYAFQTHSD